MEISTATNATNIAAVASNTKSPDADFETPVRIHSSNTKPLTFTNGVLKRHLPLLHHHHHGGTGTTNVPIVVVYKECLKNHAASLGGHALDGCGEFMPSPTATPTDPTSLKCAACGCHRNFHRREPDDPIPLPATTTATTTQVIEYQPHHRHHPPPPPPRGHSPSPPSPPPISSSYYPSSAPHMLLALSAGLQGGPPPPPTDNPHSMGLFGTPTMAANTNSGTATNHNGRKRFRTRFSQGQKEKMYEFAERVGWKMQKKDEETVSEFCNEIGVDRSVLKVWMHNNKNSLGKKSSPPIPSLQADHHHHLHLNGSSRNGTTFDQNDTTTTNNNNNDEDEDDDENNIQHHHNGGTNGSSSSS